MQYVAQKMFSVHYKSASGDNFSSIHPIISYLITVVRVTGSLEPIPSNTVQKTGVQHVQGASGGSFHYAAFMRLSSLVRKLQ